MDAANVTVSQATKYSYGWLASTRLEDAYSAIRANTGLHVLILVLLCCIGFMSTLHTFRLRHEKAARAIEFANFAAAHKGTCTQQALPYGIIPSLRHKVHMLMHRKEDLIGQVFGSDFRTHGATHALYDRYGLTKVVHTIDPINIHTVLASRAPDYGIPAARTYAIAPVGSKGVVMTEGATWLRNRKAINRGFRGARFTDGIEENIQALFRSVSAAVDSEGWTEPVPLFDAFAFMSLDRSIRHMFGVRADLQATSGEPMQQRLRWKKAFDTLADFVAVRSVLGKMSWMYDGPSFRAACALLRRLCETTIEAAVQRSKENSAVEASFIGNLIHEDSDARRICDITLDVFIAGHNMTSGVLSWLFFELEKRPDIYASVREEVLEVFGIESQAKLEMTWETLQRCERMGHCIHEAMRLYPTLPNIGRRADRDTILPTGGGPDGRQPVTVAKGTTVMCCLYLMHRRSEEWGSDTEEFKPERWEGRVPGHEYAPFGGGPRTCPGRIFGLVELFYVTAKILQHFQAIRQPPGEVVAIKGSGAGVLLPPAEATLQMQAA